MSTTPHKTVDSAESPGPAGDTSSSAVDQYVTDALGLPTVERWSFDLPGDKAAGALIRYGERKVPSLRDDGTMRTIPVIILHGCTVIDGDDPGPIGYIEVAGFSQVLERKLHQLQGCEVGTLVRITYTGHRQSPTKGHNDYADFDIVIGRRTDLVPLDVITDAPEIEHLNMPMGELNAGEPF